jgi:ubiquinone/menaquinone biosynthesis C-methylase UbiE
MYTYIVANVPKGSRILEVGGGDSRILKYFAKDYECWNVDKCEGLGNGPIQFTSPHYRIVYDYLGSFNPELPDAHFDFVFSISALEHTPEDQSIRENLVRDLQRILKPGAATIHLFDCIWRRDSKTWINGLVPYLYATVPAATKFVSPAGLENDPSIYYMSEAAFTASWTPILKKSYQEYGRPYSMNVSWLRASA